MAPDQVGPDEDTGVTALSNCGATTNTTVFVTVPASPFPAREELSSENVSVGGDKDKDNSTDDNEDDDLTSLSWLQNKNLLKGVHELPKTDYVDDASSDSRSSSGQSISPVRCWPAMATLPNNNNNNNINSNYNNTKTSSLRSSSYDPKVHTESKPPYSFSCLIFMAIEDSPIKALPVKDIYGWIVDHFPYYKNAPTGWKNSVRHNLSLNKCFRKVEKAPNLGKGSLWMVEPSYRPCLIQALQKTPYTKGYSKKSTVNTSPASRGENLETIIKDERSEDEMSTVSDVDAATAMLVLKHGPHVRIVHDRDWQLTQTKPDTDPELAELYPIVTICPSEDHTYDNCFKMDSLCKEDAEERRKIVEGADALLNLAGITTRRLRKRSSSVECIDAKRECTETLRQMYLKRQTENNNEPSSVIIEHHKDKFR